MNTIPFAVFFYKKMTVNIILLVPDKMKQEFLTHFLGFPPLCIWFLFHLVCYTTLTATPFSWSRQDHPYRT